MLLQFNYNLTQLSRTTSSSSSSSMPSSSSSSASASESAMNRKLLSSSRMLRRQRNGDSFSFLYYPLVLTVTLLLVLNPAQLTAAERDFNFNDSQVPLIEPKDEPQTHVEAVPLDSAAHQHETEHQHQHPHQHQHQHQHQHHHQPQHNSHQDPYAVELSHCRYGDNEIVLSLILKNYNWHDLNESRRAKVLEKLSKFFAIPKEFITMESVTKHDLYEMQKEALKKGNNKCHQNNRKLGRATFIIGCGTTYFSMGEPISKQITQQVKDGSLDNITGEKFGWWVIWKKHYKARAERNRRQIEGSGDDDADNDDDDYDYEYEDEETIDDPAAGIASNASPGRSPAQTEITSNNIDAANTKDDITALKQTDPSEHDDRVADKKTDSNLLLLNKKGTIDAEIVESVSQLESVITKTIENTKNIEPDLPVVEQPDDDIIPEEISANAGKSLPSLDNINLNNVYERPEDGGDKTNNQDFNIAEVMFESTTITANTITPATEHSVSTSLENIISHENTQANSNAAGGSLFTTNSNDIESPEYPATHQHHHHHVENHNTHHNYNHNNHEHATHHSNKHELNENSEIDATTIEAVIATATAASTISSPSSSSVSSAATVLPLMENTSTTIAATSVAPIVSSSPSSSSSLSSSHATKDADGTTLETEDNQEDVNKTSATPTSPLEDSSATTTIASTSAASAAAITTTSTSSEPETTTPAASPDYVEPKAENTPPMIKTRLQKFAVTSGKSFRYAIPSDTFHDNEDFSNLRLDLTDKDGNELKSNSWLQFNAESKEIYGLPLDDAVSKWQYRLTATDSGNESVAETVEISVQQHRGLRTVNHEINVAVKINEKNIHYIDWQMSLINAIATTLGDDNSNSIVVREIRQNPQDSALATLVFFNETLPTSECPEMQLNNLVKRLDAQRLSDLVQPTLGIKSITGQLIGSCQKLAATVKPKLPSIPVKNAPPVLLNQVDHIVATVGHLLVYKVPHDAFFDAENSALKLSLKTKEHKELSARHWLQFDAKNQEFYGVPKSGDAGSEEYNLVAEDAGGLSVSDALVVQVNHAPKKEFSIYVKAYLAVKHEHFNADLQRKFVERIAALFGDVSTQNLQIRSVTTNHDNGGTIVNFYNTTLFKSHNHCPEEEIEAVTSVYQMQERVKKALGPELELTNAQIVPFASCHAQTDTTHREFIPNKNDEPLLKSTFSDNYLYTIILPAVIIVSMIIIASLVACCLHRRRHKSGKMELGDEEERKSFRTKGIPVIFQDELDEKPEIGNKSPIILKDEKPPLLPPSYNTSNMNGDNDVDEYVPPPAVVVGGREARGKSPATPSYRKPPPYVSP